MPKWSLNIIDSAVLNAESSGFDKVILGSPYEAELFRDAILNRRRIHHIGQNITTKVIGSEVHIFRKPEIRRE
jgi:hypothetical protein